MKPEAERLCLEGMLAQKIAERVKAAERKLEGGHLETKEVRNVVSAVLRERETADLLTEVVELPEPVSAVSAVSVPVRGSGSV